jgi:hypothetical protein
MSNIVKSSDSNNVKSSVSSTDIVLKKLLEMGCVTWDLTFAKKNHNLISDVLTNEINYENISTQNKWGYQYHIKLALEKVAVDYNDIDSVRNMIIMNHFVIKLDRNKNRKYVTVNPTSIYDIFNYYRNKFRKNISTWNDSELSDLKNLHEILKKNNCQYTFFGVDENKLDYFVNAIKHLQEN